MYPTIRNKAINTILFLFLLAGLLPAARGAICKSQSQMTPAQRSAIENAARTIATQVQS